MSAGSVDPPPVRGPQGWTPFARVEASAQLRARLEPVAIVWDVARVRAEYFREFFDARSVSVTTLGDGLFNELVNVGSLPPPSRWYPDETVYPESV
ncbi:MAG: hypothetical protein LH645_04885 [Actinomycetia bacterium]|nr:hypothetical protein [Actinomycetes bacterium]